MSKLTECKTCNKTVSRKAKSCPHCGQSNPGKRKRAKVVFAAAAIATGVAFSLLQSDEDVVASSSSGEHPSDGAAAAASVNDDQTDWREHALAHVLSDNEPIREGTWSTPGILWLSRDDDGSRHDGFAEYVCAELRDQGKPEGSRVVIKIWSHQGMLREQLNKIGAHTCK